MRIANLAGRLVLVTDTGAVDVEEASRGQFGPDPTAIYRRWPDFTAWAESAELPSGRPYDDAELGAPVPEPGQVFAIGLNYRAHATESGFDFPVEPPVFTKFRTSITGPVGDLALPGETVDWEAELVVVIGREARHVAAADAWTTSPADRRAGLLRAHAATRRARTAVQPRQVVPRLRADRPGRRHARRAAGPRRPRDRLQHQRGTGPEGPHQRPDLLDPGPHRATLRGPAAAAG